MSYDLMVFDPEAAPEDRQQFKEWYDDQSEWAHSMTTPEVCTPRLRAWFMEMIRVFPVFNPFAPEELLQDEPSLTEYSISTTAS